MKKRLFTITVAIISFLNFNSPSCIAQNWTAFTMSNSELGSSVLAMASDNKGTKWFGTDLGMARLQGKTWTDFSMFNEKLKDQFVNCLTVDSRGVLWIGTDDYGVIEFDGSRWTEHKEEMKKLQMKFISKIAIDRNNVKWIGVTLGGLVKYDGKEWIKYTAANSQLLSDFILSVAVDRSNRKWIGTNDGLSVFDEKKWISYTTANSQLPHNIVTAVAIDANDVKWLATLGGLVRIEGDKWTVYNKSNSPLPCNEINDLAFDPSGGIWMGTDKGVSFFDGKNSWVSYDCKNSILPNDAIRRVMVDQQGTKWFGSNLHGLVRLSAHIVIGRIVDEKGSPVSGITVSDGRSTATTDNDGYYRLEIAAGTSATVTPRSESHTFEPEALTLPLAKGTMTGQNFVAMRGMLAQGNSKEKVVVNPYLEQGYITITMESATAEVEFVNARGESIRTIPQYNNGARITISKMPKGNYTLFIRTAKGEKKLQFNLK